MKIYSLPLLCYILFSSTGAHACGYAWVGDCSSQVQLRINGTLDSFDIAACPSGFNFDGIQLGNLQTLSLANAKTITWESCQNNVTAVFLKYRVYEQGANAGAWQTMALQQYHQTIDGPYTTRYSHAPANINVTNGLIIGKTYFMELYFVAEIDTIGDDYIPETTMLKNNNGANYKMLFTFGGTTAPPILLLPHLTEPSCNGGNNGNIHVSAYGNIQGLFYSWSNISLNFFQQFNLSAGNYGITVTNAAGQTASADMQLGQPEALSANFSNIQSVGCNNGLGYAVVLGSGGTAPYHYLWQTGIQNDTAFFQASGNYRVTVSDAHNCSATAIASIASDGLVTRNIAASICEGEVYAIGGQLFSAADHYSFTIPGASGCDTLIYLTLEVLTPSDALASLPDSILLTCLQPQVNLCAIAYPGATFQWEKDGAAVATTPCLLAAGAGEYRIEVSMGACTSEKTVVASEHLAPVPAQVTGLMFPTCNGIYPIAWLVAHSDAESPIYAWVYNGDTISTSDSCFCEITQFQGGQPVFPSLSITDIYGCVNTTPAFNVNIVQLPALNESATVLPASGMGIADGSIHLSVTGGLPPYNYIWDNGLATATITGLLPGVFCVTVSDSRGCKTQSCHVVSVASGTVVLGNEALRVFPNPANAGSYLQVVLPTALQGRNIDIGLFDMQGNMLVKPEHVAWACDKVAIKIPEGCVQSALLLRLTENNRSYIATLLVHY